MYWTVTALTTKAQVDRLYEYVKGHHEDEHLPITYDSFEASQDYCEWIESNVGSVYLVSSPCRAPARDQQVSQ